MQSFVASVAAIYLASFGCLVTASDDCSSLQTQNFPGGRICVPSCGEDRPGGDYANQYVGSADQCFDACGADSNCLTAQFHVDNGYCYLKSGVNERVFTNGTDTFDCGLSTQSFSNGRICTATGNADRPGGDYGNQYAGSLDACIKACGADPQCSSAQYRVDNGYCYFKDYDNDLTPTNGTNTVDCCLGSQTFANGRVSNPTCNQDRPGGDYAQQYTGSFEDCVDACAQDVNCLTAQYSRTNGYCYFKNGVNQAVSKPDIDTVDFS